MTAADDGLATNERVRAFLDGLAALTTTHGLVLDVYQGTICLDPVPADSRSFGGYAAAHRSGNYWEVYPFEAGAISQGWSAQDERAASIDIACLSAHQRIAIQTVLQRVQAIVPT